MASKLELVLENMKSKLTSSDINLKDFQSIATSSYKEVFKARSKSGGEKKKPNLYNEFIRNEIIKIKSENLGVDPKDYMKIAAQRWQENKTKSV